MKKTILLIFATVIFCSCEKSSDPQISKVDTSYFPLQVGNAWKYVPVLEREDLLSIDVHIPSTATIANHEYYLFVTKYIYKTTTSVMDSVYYRIDSTNGYVFERAVRSLAEANSFRLKAVDGETWTIDTPPLKGFVVKNTNISSLELSTIAIENCKSYYFDFPPTVDDEHILILAPGLGKVKQLFSGGFDSTLEEATIGGIKYSF